MLDRSLVVAGHQPNFFPWFGYFEKMLKCDIFVYSDDVQYPKQSYTNRVEMLQGKSVAYLTLPVLKGNDGRIADKAYLKDQATLNKLLKTLRTNLGSFPYFADLASVVTEFEIAYWQFQTVADFNIHMNQYLAGLMGVATPVRRGTALGLERFHRNERLAQRCLQLNAGVYLCGRGADGYQDDAYLEAAGIEVRKVDYHIGQALFGDDLRYTVLHGIAKYGLHGIQTAVSAYRNAGCDS